jgi:glutathione S-transferase
VKRALLEVPVKLYFKPGACSLSPHIVLRELGLSFDLEAVDTKAQKTATGADYTAINPKKYVPALQLDDGQVLTEGAAIVQYLADRKPDAMLAPPWGSLDRYRLQEWLNYVASELHKSYGPIFRASEEQRPALREVLTPKLDFVARHLDKRQFVMGDRFTVADAYLFTVLNWSSVVGIDLGRWPAVKSYLQRVSSRPAVRATLEAEGLLRG